MQLSAAKLMTNVLVYNKPTHYSSIFTYLDLWFGFNRFHKLENTFY